MAPHRAKCRTVAALLCALLLSAHVAAVPQANVRRIDPIASVRRGKPPCAVTNDSSDDTPPYQACARGPPCFGAELRSYVCDDEGTFMSDTYSYWRSDETGEWEHVRTRRATAVTRGVASVAGPASTVGGVVLAAAGVSALIATGGVGAIALPVLASAGGAGMAAGGYKLSGLACDEDEKEAKKLHLKIAAAVSYADADAAASLGSGSGRTCQGPEAEPSCFIEMTQDEIECLRKREPSSEARTE